MGRQITVEIKDLVKAGCTIVPNTATWTGLEWNEEAQDDILVTHISVYITVVIPGGNAVSSYCEDTLVFDCRDKDTSTYGWVEYWLIQNNVPYYEG